MGFKHVLWWCRKEGFELKRGGPPDLNLIREGVGGETAMFETDFVKLLRHQVAASKTTGAIDLSFRNLTVRAAVARIGPSASHMQILTCAVAGCVWACREPGTK